MVFEKVREIIANQLNKDANSITLDTHLVDDLGADSLDAVDLIMAIEDEFGIELDDETAQNVRKVSDLVSYIEANK